jgi:hypothetical protein
MNGEKTSPTNGCHLMVNQNVPITARADGVEEAQLPQRAE